MTAGMAHIAAGVGADAEFRAPMALVVIGGLVTSTLLSLVAVPVVYTLVDDAWGWLARPWRAGNGPGPADVGREEARAFRAFRPG
jgi:hypothetical protein